MKEMLRETSIKEMFSSSFGFFRRQTNRRYGTFFARLINWISMFWCVLRHGSSPAEYAHLDFDRKSERERSGYFTMFRFERFIKKVNTGDPAVFIDKTRFNERFSEYLNRDWLDLSRASREEFEAFVRRHGTIMLKATSLSCGKGITRYTWHEGDDLAALYESSRDMLAEEFLVQHPAVAAFNPASTNVPRLNTMLDRNGEPVLFTAFFRTGAGDAVVDNLGAGGMAAHIDPDTGIVDTLAVDEDAKEYLVHPVTGEVFPGFCIPRWEEAKQLVLRAAKEVPEMRYIGWDVAVTADGVCLIEGNDRADICVRQFVDRRGWRRELTALI